MTNYRQNVQTQKPFILDRETHLSFCQFISHCGCLLCYRWSNAICSEEQLIVLHCSLSPFNLKFEPHFATFSFKLISLVVDPTPSRRNLLPAFSLQNNAFRILMILCLCNVHVQTLVTLCEFNYNISIVPEHKKKIKIMI